MLVFLTTVSGILKPIAFILGLILNGIYELINLIGINNLAVCIILFTIVTRMLMLPLTIKQQKFTKLSALMNPELQAVQEKYRNKKDEASQRRMQEETQEIYRKYGASPLGGCLPLLITLPIMFALYRVIYKMPAYITDVKAIYDNLVVLFQGSGVADQTTAMNIISNFVSGFGVSGSARGLLTEIGKYTFGSDDFKNACIDVFAYFNAANWSNFVNGTLIESDSWNALMAATGQTADTWISYLKTALGDDYMTTLNTMDITTLGTALGIENLSESVSLSDVAGSVYWNTYALGSNLKSVFSSTAATGYIDEILHINGFIGGMTILDTPSAKIMPGIFIPILSAVTQIIQTKLTTSRQDQNSKKREEESAMAQSMKGMTTVMPIVSAFICFTLPVGVGLYWITGTVVQIIQQLAINAYIDKQPIEEIIQKSVEKSEKRMARYGVVSNGQGNVSYVAKTSTKSLADISKIKSDRVSAADSNSNDQSNSGSTGASGSSSGSTGKSSISDLANIMKNRNK